MAGVGYDREPVRRGSRCSTLQAMLAVRGWELGPDGITMPPSGKPATVASCGTWWVRTGLPERRRVPRDRD